tara:strand:+ start:70 stop:357 length:288 start_codon:yes stop_codon:yes gene_type:complete
MKVEKLSLVELTELNRRIEAAIPIARSREEGELRKQLSEMAAKSGFKLSDLFGASATIRKPIAPKYRDRKTGVMWTGRGRPPRMFDKARAEALSA